jgi:predicted DNA-binding transcriptional regulator YafY
MRVARLLSIVFEVDARPGITAAELAAAFGVSARTVYRDVVALQQAGFPLYGTTGPNGGLRLVDGYRSRAGALRADEAAALLAGVVPGVAEQLGLHADFDRAQRKVRSQSGHQERRASVLVDPIGWYRTPDETPHLATLVEALRTHTMVTMGYSRWEAPTHVQRTIAPLGLVLKAGAWYVMARSRRQVRTYRVNQIRSARLTTRRYEPDPSFDLAAAWAAFVSDFRQRLHVLDAQVRVSRAVRDWIRSEGDCALGEALDHFVPLAAEHDGEVEVLLPFESVERAAAELLRFGTGVEVVGPPELRRHIASIASALAETYA